MKFSQIKEIKKFADNLFSTPDYREIIEHINKQETDFTVDDVRFIHTDFIHDVLADELSFDEYVLGCFTAESIAEATGWPIELIEETQKAGANEAIGKAMTGAHVNELAHIYANSDGYGHHFNGYDFSEEELIINGELFHVFDNH